MSNPKSKLKNILNNNGISGPTLKKCVNCNEKKVKNNYQTVCSDCIGLSLQSATYSKPNDNAKNNKRTFSKQNEPSKVAMRKDESFRGSSETFVIESLHSDQGSMAVDTLKNDGKCVKYNLRDDDDDDDDDEENEEEQRSDEGSEQEDEIDDEDTNNETRDFNQDSINQSDACYDSDNASTIVNDSIPSKETNCWLPNKQQQQQQQHLQRGGVGCKETQDELKNQLKLAMCEANQKKEKYHVESDKKIKNALETMANSKVICKNMSKPIEKMQKNLELKNKMQLKKIQNEMKDEVIETNEFIEEMDRNVERMIEKEKINFQKDLQKSHNKIGKLLGIGGRDDHETSTGKIEGLNNEIFALKDEIFDVKKRNKQLAFILAQGEMKEKTDLLIQIDELKAFKDELTMQVTELQENLQKEKNKVQKLEKELKKLRQSK